MKQIEIKGARQNNLKSLDLKIPLGAFVVLCGRSGSGKSSLAFETLFAEGQRHYTETLSNYARQYIQERPRPLVQSIKNLPPCLALEQKNSVRSGRPTVAGLTELSDFLRLLFTHLGEVFCPEHGEVLSSFSPSEGAKKIKEKFTADRGMILVPLYPLPDGKQPKDLKKKLMRDGFSRLGWKKGKSSRFRLCELSSKVKIPQERPVYIVLDRLLFKEQDRLKDSLKSAYRIFLEYNKAYSKGQAVALSLEDKYLFLNEDPVCPSCAYQFPVPLRSSLFDFNSSLGACPSCRGFGGSLNLDEKKIVPDPEKSLLQGALIPFSMPSANAEFRSLKSFCLRRNIDLHLPYKDLPARHKKAIWKGSARFIGVRGFFEYLESRKYKIHVRIFLSRYKSSVTCSACQGARFRKELSYVRFRNLSLPDMMARDIGSLRNFFEALKLSQGESRKAGRIIEKIRFILGGLCHIGLDYLNLNRLVKTLSSGEFQRLNLVHQTALGLSQVLYVLDEPTLGLHARDSLRLTKLLEALKSEGNTLVVVEHDPDMIRRADFVVELGPGSGAGGGEVVFAGSQKDFMKSSSLTCSYLNKKSQKVPILPVQKEKYKYFLELSGCRAHNLKNICLKVPLNRFVTVTGVSGSGKSTLVMETLYPALARLKGEKALEGQPYKSLTGAEYLRQVVRMDSAPLEKSRRSLPVTYLKIYDQIRNLMAAHASPSLNIRPGVFSLNVEGGRCPACQGMGRQEVEMVFMDPILIPCEECGGKRFKPEILRLKWKGKDIHQILSLTAKEALEFFVSFPAIYKPLSFLKRVGLDYLLLGQSLSTLSGGEAQRLKLARELLQSKAQKTLYILDEPTVGLHFQEVDMLLKLLRDLIEKGGSVLLIEHNMEVIRQSDYLIDIGPLAGPKGGRICAEGSPDQLMKNSSGCTARALKRFEDQM